MKKRNISILLCIIAVVLVSFLGYNLSNRMKEQELQDYITTEHIDSKYYYNQLNDEEKHLYVLIHQDPQNFYKNSDVEISYTRFQEFIQYFYLDNPEYKFAGIEGGGYTAYSGEGFEDRLKEVDEILKPLYKELESIEDVQEKYDCIYNYIMNNVKISLPPLSLEMYLTLKYGGDSVGRCDIFKYVCNLYGLPCVEIMDMSPYEGEVIHANILIPNESNEGLKETEISLENSERLEFLPSEYLKEKPQNPKEQQ